MDHSDFIVCSIMGISIGLKRVKLCVYVCEISSILPCSGSDVFAYFILILISLAFLQTQRFTNWLFISYVCLCFVLRIPNTLLYFLDLQM